MKKKETIDVWWLYDDGGFKKIVSQSLISIIV